MQVLIAFIVFGTVVFAKDVQSVSEPNPEYGYMKNIGIPLAERIRKAEEAEGARIIGGAPATVGKYPFLAGILVEIDINDNVAMSVCSGALISVTRVVTAAHCWSDGFLQARQMTVSLGSIYLFSGGIRVQTSAVALHPNWNPALVRNDVAVAYFASPVGLSDTVAPIALPSRSELLESFAGERAIAIGFGVTSDGISTNQSLSHVSVSVLSNSDCSVALPIIQSSNICTSGFCNGHSGSPLIINRNNRPVLIGVVSFGSAQGCTSRLPKAYARITSFMDFINQHI